MSSKSKVNSLLASIQRTPSAAPEAEAVPVVPPARRDRKTPPRSAPVAHPEPKNKVGKPVQFWFHDEDRQLVRELAAWLAGQGIRSTDSMVLRAALRTAKTGGELLEAYRQASQLDGRLKQHKAESNQSH
jgi:hypothetical protein